MDVLPNHYLKISMQRGLPYNTWHVQPHSQDYELTTLRKMILKTWPRNAIQPEHYWRVKLRMLLLMMVAMAMVAMAMVVMLLMVIMMIPDIYPN